MSTLKAPFAAFGGKHACCRRKKAVRFEILKEAEHHAAAQEWGRKFEASASTGKGVK